jgi:hypothetical protein
MKRNGRPTTIGVPVLPMRAPATHFNKPHTL